MIDDARSRSEKHAEISARAQDAAKIEQVLNEVARKTVQEHARAGRKIPVWRDGQVVWILPEIEDDGEK
ncbi:hypothetical protein Mal52_22130 [Symmachiella dynata]|uniref:Uncharacterized protein n=1 Tax=Symmachiella dynata TaxID=2527995 RepID=A0A517ZMQ7_9PLAN|nr:hypothetical protein [Symmachiella dynata]QDU43737.1 hypothetical protein Mal52_22130 [Symmachiella dynata]